MRTEEVRVKQNAQMRALYWKRKGERNKQRRAAFLARFTEYEAIRQERRAATRETKAANFHRIKRLRTIRSSFSRTRLLKSADPSERNNVYSFASFCHETTGPCYWCGAITDKLTIDHLTPVSRSGKHELSNLQAVCVSCNCSKSNRTAEEYIARLGGNQPALNTEVKDRWEKTVRYKYKSVLKFV